MELLGGIEERVRKGKREERKRDEEAELGREEIGYISMKLAPRYLKN